MKKLYLASLIVIAGAAVVFPHSRAIAASPAKKNAEVSPTPEAKAHLYASPDEAAKALQAAAEANDIGALKDIFGPNVKEIVSGDEVQTKKEIANFVKIIEEECVVSKVDDNKVVLHLGSESWPFPIPLVKQGDGQWSFDTLAGKQEIVDRRVGENELNTIAICRAYVAAQRQYASADRDGSEVLKYAQKVRSTGGKKDGLYWDAPANEEQSPFGPLIASAQEEGYTKKKEGEEPAPYHGYYFKILKAQGSAAPGGAYNYVINGNMIGGFALIAWPAIYGQSGVMTFIVNQQGKVYQKSLGTNTDGAAKAITAYNPDKSWTLVTEESQPDSGQAADAAAGGDTGKPQ